MGPAVVSRKDLARALKDVVGGRVSQVPADRRAYARDLWPRTILALRDGETAPYPPDLIVWPETTDEVAAIIKLAAQRRIPVTPFGAGSGVCGGAAPTRGGIVLDLKRMSRAVSIDADALEATFECGILGDHLEHELARRGLTLGHFPSSIMCSTLGGWLAARSAGQLSTKYGKIEDLALALEVVTGAGEVCVAGREPRGAPGPDWAQLFIGSEGTLGVITRATLRVRPAPEVRLLRGWEFPRVAVGCEAIRRLLQRGLRPAVVRLYDELDSFLHRSSSKGAGDGKSAPHAPTDLELRVEGAKKWLLRSALAYAGPLNSALGALLPRIGGTCLLILGFEGDRELCESEVRVAQGELERVGGKDLGEGPGLRWFDSRYKISFQQSKVFENGAFVDTMEVAATWDRVLDLYAAVRAAVARNALVMAHFSHAYPEGCSIYFTFVSAGRDRADAERRYDAIWRAGMTATLAAGGVLSHHHGIGMSKQKYLPEELGAGMDLLRALKQALDPAGILNPGKLGLP
ncbi:MAG TPA: FAD-binding oxidoreductase [Polyangia bacterium]|nr:FAD-binding oxidoreductase [Polyangia bacterium]